MEEGVSTWTSYSYGNVKIGECNLRGQNLKVVRKTGGKTAFYKLLIMHLLDTYFVKIGEYTYNHIPVPLTFSQDSRYFYYLYVEGKEGFWWEEKVGLDNYDVIIYRLDELPECDAAFRKAGMNINNDDKVITQDSGWVQTSKNFILDMNAGYSARKVGDWKVILPKSWVAIDLDSLFIRFDKDKFNAFLTQNRDSLAEILGNDKLRLFYLSFFSADF